MLEEFQFSYGDPRPNLFRYLSSLQNTETYVMTSHKKTVNDTDMFKFVCNPEVKKREFRTPPPSLLKRFEKALVNTPSKAPILLTPVLLINKLNCKQRNSSKHMNILLYNRLTHEIDRIDIRKYHISGFSLKLFIKKLNEEFMTKIVLPHDPAVTIAPEIDVPLAFMKKHKIEKAHDAYPRLMIAYLHQRLEHPTKTSEEVVKTVGKLSPKTVIDYWNSYIAFRHHTDANKCKEGMTENPETGRCLRPLSKTFIKNMLDKPHKPCENDKVHNALTGKCVHPDKLVDVNILLDEILNIKKTNDKDIMPNVDSISIGAMNFILRNFPYAHFIYPRDNSARPSKRDFSIYWQYNETTKTFEHNIPPRFWEMWQEPMSNPAIRFIIAFVSLKSTIGGVHANVYIYDKNTNEVERFDGLGRDISVTYNITELDNIMREAFTQQTILFPKPVKYYTPLDFCPKMPVFQSKELDDIPGKDLRGNCAVWRLWYVHVRLANPHLKRKQLVLLASKKLEQTGSLYKFIKSYQRYLLQSYKTRKP